MAQTATVTMLFGDDARVIPVDQVDSAKGAGGKVAVKMVGPDNTPRWIPADQSQAAAQKGWKNVPLVPEASPLNFDFGEAASYFGGELKSAVKGALSLFDAPSGKVEAGVNALGPPALPIYRMLRGESQSRTKLARQAQEQFKSGHPVLGTTSLLIAALPVPGVPGMATGINDAQTPEEAVGRGTADAAMFAVPEAAGRIVPPILRKIPEAFRKGVQRVVGAGGKTIAADIETTAAARHGEVLKHFDDTHADEPPSLRETGRAPTPTEQVSRRQAIERGIERSDPEIRTDLEATEKRVNAEANQKYADLRKVLKDEQSGMYQPKGEDGHVEGEPISIPERLNDTADESLRGSDSAPTIIKDIAKRVQQGETSLSYDDLQGYREEIGRELRKGTLPPDVFNAYKKMMPMIDDAMQEIADRHGLGKAQSDARNFYRNYAQTFLDNDSPVRKALDSKERGETTKAFQGKDQSGVERLARYNPELAKRINTVRGLQEEAARLPNEKPPKFEKPNPLSPKEEISLPAKREALVKKWAMGEGTFNKWQVRSLLTGGIGSVFGYLMEGTRGAEILGTASYVLGPSVVAKIVETPAVLRWLTKTPEGELAALKQLPYADRLNITDGLSRVAKAAEAKGVKVDPALLSFLAASSKSAPQPKTGPLAQSPIP